MKALKELPNHMKIANKQEFAKIACQFYLDELKRKKVIKYESLTIKKGITNGSKTTTNTTRSKNIVS